MFNVNYALVLGSAALIVAVIGLVRGQLRMPGLPALQAPAMLVCGAVVLAVGYGASTFGGVLLGIALIGHGVWDMVHWRANKIVSRSLAEWCAALDFVLGTGILILFLL